MMATLDLCPIAAPPPVDIVIRATSSSSIEVRWQAPPAIPGELRGYVVRYRREDGVLSDANVSENRFVS